MLRNLVLAPVRHRRGKGGRKIQNKKKKRCNREEGPVPLGIVFNEAGVEKSLGKSQERPLKGDDSASPDLLYDDRGREKVK